MKKIMKVNVLDAHDRMKHLIKQDMDIGACCQSLVDQKPFGNRPFYIFAHTRTDDDGVNKRLIWQPRLFKPKMEPNSMLFKGYPGTDQVKVIWILPAQELWQQYELGLLTENKTVLESIWNFRYNKGKMEADEEDDPSEIEAKAIYLEIMHENNKKRGKTRIITDEN